MTVVDRLEPPEIDESPSPDRAGKRNVVAEIAERRRADIREEMASLSLDDHLAIAAATPAPRPILDRLAAPGLHVIAEIKRTLAVGRADRGDRRRHRGPRPRLRGRRRGGDLASSASRTGSAAPSTTSRAVRAAVSIPVLAKEFVVEPIQLPHLRAAGADLVLLLAVLHPRDELAALVDRALEIGLEPLVEAHDERELERALATNARLIGLNNRDLRTLEVDTERAVRLRGARARTTGSSSPSPASATPRRSPAGGPSASTPRSSARRSSARRTRARRSRAFVAAGREPADPANEAARPFVKICGVTDADGILAAVRAGADAIGLNLVPGTPRELALDEAVELRRVVRALAPGGRAPLVVAITADAGEERIAEIVAAPRPRRRPALRRRATGADRPDRPAGLEGAPPARGGSGRRRGGRGTRRRARPRAPRGGRDAPPARHRRRAPSRRHRHPRRAAARRRRRPRAAGDARRRPRSPASVAAAAREAPVVGVDVASGVERPRVDGRAPDEGPAQGRAVREARPGRPSRPAERRRPARPPSTRACSRPTTAAAGARIAQFGGRYVPETLMAALRAARGRRTPKLRHDPRFWSELRELLARFAGRPTPLYRADRFAYEALERAIAADGPARLPRRLRAPPEARGPGPHRRPQDQQRAGPGAADAAARQDPGHRRDRRRPARRRDRDGLRAARPAVRRLHGRRGHRAPAARTCSGCRRSARRSARSRAAARRSRTRSTTRCGTGSRTSRRRTTCSARRWARIPTRRSSATSSGGSATRPRPRSSRSRAGCRTSPWPASAAARTRSGCWRGSSASRRSGSRSPRPRATGSRPADTRRRSPAGRRGSSTGPAR